MSYRRQLQIPGTDEEALSYREVDPALFFCPRFQVGWVLRELALFVENLSKVDKDGGRLEDACAFVRECGDAAVGIDFKEPRRLDLVVDFSDIGVPDAHLDGAARICACQNEISLSTSRRTRSLARRKLPFEPNLAVLNILQRFWSTHLQLLEKNACHYAVRSVEGV